MHLIRRSHKVRFGIIHFATFGAVRAHILQSYRRILFIDGIEQSFVANVLFGNEGNAFSLGRTNTRSKSKY